MSIYLLILINCFFCFGLRYASEPYMILEHTRLWAENYLPFWIHKPIISCCSCMASFWGILFYLVWSYDHTIDICSAIVYVVCLCSLNTFLWHLYLMIYLTIKKLLE